MLEDRNLPSTFTVDHLADDPSCGTLSGTLTVTVSGGIATFSNLSIDLAGDGYTLHAATTGLTDADSVAFSITA
jgi:hypothetical protein